MKDRSTSRGQASLVQQQSKTSSFGSGSSSSANTSTKCNSSSSALKKAAGKKKKNSRSSTKATKTGALLADSEIACCPKDSSPTERLSSSSPTDEIICIDTPGSSNTLDTELSSSLSLQPQFISTQEEEITDNCSSPPMPTRRKKVLLDPFHQQPQHLPDVGGSSCTSSSNEEADFPDNRMAAAAVIVSDTGSIRSAVVDENGSVRAAPSREVRKRRGAKRNDFVKGKHRVVEDEDDDDDEEERSLRSSTGKWQPPRSPRGGIRHVPASGSSSRRSRSRTADSMMSPGGAAAAGDASIASGVSAFSDRTEIVPLQRLDSTRTDDGVPIQASFSPALPKVVRTTTNTSTSSRNEDEEEEQSVHSGVTLESRARIATSSSSLCSTLSMTPVVPEPPGSRRSGRPQSRQLLSNNGEKPKNRNHRNKGSSASPKRKRGGTSKKVGVLLPTTSSSTSTNGGDEDQCPSATHSVGGSARRRSPSSRIRKEDDAASVASATERKAAEVPPPPPPPPPMSYHTPPSGSTKRKTGGSSKLKKLTKSANCPRPVLSCLTTSQYSYRKLRRKQSSEYDNWSGTNTSSKNSSNGSARGRPRQQPPQQHDYSVAFDGDVRVRKTLRRKDYSERETKNAWFSDADFNRTIQRCMRIVDEINEYGSTSHCSRGMEKMSKSGMSQVYYSRQDAYKAVLEGQQQQKQTQTPFYNSGIMRMTPEEISHRYQPVSEKSLRRARRLAEDDQKAAAQFLANAKALYTETYYTEKQDLFASL